MSERNTCVPENRDSGDAIMNEQKKCPACGNLMPIGSLACPHCGRLLPDPETRTGNADRGNEGIDALKALANDCNLPLRRITPADVDDAVVALLPADFATAKLVLPINRDEKGIVVGISDPTDVFLIDDVTRRLRSEIRFVVVPPEDILNILDKRQTPPEIVQEQVNAEVEEVTDLDRHCCQSPVVRYVNCLIATAITNNATHIHIAPEEKFLRVAFRIDGVLFEQAAPPVQMFRSIIGRLRIMADMNIADRRLPQDGRISAMVGGQNFELFVSTMPTRHAEKCVIRIVGGRSAAYTLEDLGMTADTLEAFTREIRKPHGMVLVTGPTGSGKSTTLYSALEALQGGDMNLSTIEDPVRYDLDDINQIGIKKGTGMTFASTLRSLLLQDPDVIMLSEIRDVETARLVIQTALTGHLMLSTLHTSDAPSTITRLINMGIEPFLVAAGVNAVLAQRLVRKICENCKTPVTAPGDNTADFLGRMGLEGKELYHGTGCEICRNTGYRGRLAIHELMELDDEIREMIKSDPTLSDLRTAVRAKGMCDLRCDGANKVIAGLTTVEEIIRVTGPYRPRALKEAKSIT
ncbi:MAG: GspE/PulE family protein [Phycisphaerae bacterium]|jgi:type IV pilus assembly protein PilB|nr:GspE/PulE family protein [Phycisphaerae bacterium]